MTAIVRDTFLNNEGIFSYIAASILPDDPIPTLFFLKVRPPLAALYAAPAALGFDAFAIVHGLVAAAAVPLTAVLARANGLRWPNLAAMLVAASSLLIACAASGVGNSDALTLGVLAAVCLFAWRRPLLAGVVAAVLPLARAEMTLLVIPLAIYAVLAGAQVRLRFLAGLFAPLVAYAVLGAIYHEDVIWFLHHPPHVTHSVPYSEIMGRQMFGGDPHKVTLTLVTITPAVGMLLFLKPSTLTRPEWTILGFLSLFLGILSVLPGLSPLNFGDMPRYVVPALPFIALLSCRGIETLADGSGSERARTFGVVVLGVLLVVAHFQDAQHDAPALLWAVAGWSAVAVLAASPWHRAVPWLVVALAAVAAPFSMDATRLALRQDTRDLGLYLIAHAERDTQVLTNVPELPLWLERNGGEHLDVHHVLAADQRYELDTLANDAVGQREAAYALLRRHWYGPIVFGEDVEATLRAGTWLALREDARTTHVIDPRWLEGRSETIDLGERVSVVRVTAP